MAAGNRQTSGTDRQGPGDHMDAELRHPEPTRPEPTRVERRLPEHRRQLPPDSQMLARIVEREAVSRMLLASRKKASRTAAPLGALLGRDAIAELAGLVTTDEATAAVRLVDGLRADGVALETIYLDLLMPTAARLRRLWTEEVCDVATLKLGLWRLHLLLHRFREDFQREMRPWVRNHSALVIPSPGDPSTFELAVVEEFFRRAGWEVGRMRTTTASDIASTVRRHRFDIVWLSGSCRGRLEMLASCIGSVRRGSMNEAVGIMVNAVDFTRSPDLVRHVGAHATALDAREAPIQAQLLVSLLAQA